MGLQRESPGGGGAHRGGGSHSFPSRRNSLEGTGRGLVHWASQSLSFRSDPASPAPSSGSPPSYPGCPQSQHSWRGRTCWDRGWDSTGTGTRTSPRRGHGCLHLSGKQRWQVWASMEAASSLVGPCGLTLARVPQVQGLKCHLGFPAGIQRPGVLLWV